MAGERHGRSMGTAWYVWISLKTTQEVRSKNLLNTDQASNAKPACKDKFYGSL
jgi:hypothetical protein